MLLRTSTMDAHQAWAKSGWLASDTYYKFWGKVLAVDLKQHLEGLHIIDAGAGNGRIWEEAFSLGLKLKHLTLIDPNLNASEILTQRDDVSLFRDVLENVETATADVFFFKQSFHLLSIALGQKLFSIVGDKRIIHLAMIKPNEWPISEDLKALFIASLHDILSVPEISTKSIRLNLQFCFPVAMRRDDWLVILKDRFVSCMHMVDDAFVAKEIIWAENNLPETLEFNDCLECMIFDS